VPCVGAFSLLCVLIDVVSFLSSVLTYIVSYSISLPGMCALVSFVLPILETVVSQCSLLPPCYLCEVDGDGHVLAGVEIDVPGDGLVTMGRKFFFWSQSCSAPYEHAALQAIRFLQGLYGFIVRDYNYECVLSYRNSGNAAVVVAASAVRYAAYLERKLAYTHGSSATTPSNVHGLQSQPPPNLTFLYSRLLASLGSI